MELSRLEQQMEFLIEIDKLKSIFRQNLLADGSRHENDTEHSWHMAMMVIIFAEYFEKLDVLKTLKMVLIHDIVEIYAGDTFAYDELANIDKDFREQAAAKKIFALLPADQAEELYWLWQEFECKDSNEAICASIVDRIQPLALNYCTSGEMWRQNLVTMQKVLKRNKIVLNKGPKIIAEYVQKLIDQANQKGYFYKVD